ncbi:MAG TPA: RodZ domain-containing protein [Rhizomicrobium sp.]|nr:RodZ domain-containing protein [Rhizomicrobium sp.]
MTKHPQISLDEESGRRRIHLREISGDSEAPLETVGQDLRTARLRRGEDLATVSRALKIRKEHLEAVEEDRIEKLPGKTYAIGFVRSYATYLGLDVIALVERFKEENSGSPDAQGPSVSPVPDLETRHLTHGWRIVAVIVALLLGYGAWHLFSTSSTQVTVPPPPSLNPPKATAPKPTPAPSQTAAADSSPTDSATPAPAQTASAASSGPANPAPAPSEKASSASSAPINTASVPPAAPTDTPSATSPSPPPSAAPKPDTGGDTVAAIGGIGGTVYGEQNKNPRVILKAKADGRITVRGDDGSLYINRDLKAGDSFMVPNLPGLYLATSNAGAVEVDVDGRPLGPVGQDQEKLGRVSLDPRSLVDRFNAH